MPNSRTNALRALRDCGVIRASMGHHGFARLWSDFHALADSVEGRPGWFDFRLTDKGRVLAEGLL